VTPGLYTVETWNGKDATLISEEGELLTLTRNDLPREFGGQLFVGEKVEIFHVVTIRPKGGLDLDGRGRAARAAEIIKQNMSQKQRDFIAAENERRTRYGAKPL
jgi:hypothetical protein